MFHCPECRGLKPFFTGETFLGHIKFFHSKLTAVDSVLVCCYEGCTRKFGKYNSFRKHILSHRNVCQVSLPASNFASNLNTDCQNVNNDMISESEMDLEPMAVLDNTNTTGNVDDNVSSNSSSFDQALTSSVLSFIASLYDCGTLTEIQIQFIIESHSQLLGGGFLDILKNHVVSLLSKAKDADLVDSDELSNANRMFDSCQNMFDGFQTQYLRLKEIENCGAYIKPESFVIGHAQNVKNIDGHAVSIPIELTGQFVPFRNVLKGFFELPGVYKSILSYVTYLESSWQETGAMENLVQGELWRETIKPKFQGKSVLPIVFTFDDYETNKELGTHTGVHKLGAGYIRLGCLPPQFNSALENMFLAVLYHSADRVAGNEKVFRKVLTELKYLEQSGITVVTSDGIHQLFFALCLVTGDNLGANAILGFVESFTAKFFCRICKVSNEDAKYQTEVDVSKLRTPDSYENDVLINNCSLTGRKEACIFNDLDSFHVSENVHVDIMHDLDCGSWKYEMYLVVRYLFDKKRFNIDYLNELLQNFYYGPNEERNRVPFISYDDLIKQKRLRFSSAEMRCFVRYFSLMVGHLVQEEDKDIWNVYLTARKIVDIVTAPVVTREHSENLRQLIKIHHSEYVRCFDTYLKPKFHLMVHEPDLIMKLGPLEPLSCYRSEHKHKEGKDIAHASQNRINLPLTIAKRHQMKLAFRLLSTRGFQAKFEHSLVQSISIQNIQDYCKFQDIIPLDQSSKWNIAKWLCVNGAKYSVKTVILLSLTEDNFPVFGKIGVIRICEGQEAFFVVNLLNVQTFDEHFHAFQVEPGDSWAYVSFKNLVTYVPTEERPNANGKCYVSFRFSVNCFSSLKKHAV